MELFKIFGTVALNNSDAIKGLNETADQAEKTGTSMAKSTEKAESKMSGAFSKIGKGALAVGKVIASGVAVGTVAIAGLAKSSLDAYADYEQLVGGVETLFGAGGMSLEEYADSVGKTTSEIADEYESMIKAQKTVLNNANKAYKTAGMSANEYMETVTGFSASLIQSLGGDTEASAEKANQAIIDMADNANKMGTTLESIQNAYQGFAKQNYTMLDNLKLGYGGTKEEMQRLLEDAQAISGIEYDISSYADVVDAIHVIQDEMGITNTTLNEASKTISGSISAMKSSFSNLLAGFGKDDVDLSALTNEFVESFTTVMHNVIPRLQVILSGMADAIVQIVPALAEKLPELLNSLLPSLIEGAVALFNGLVSALPTVLQILIQQLPFIITQLGTALMNTIPVLFDVLTQFVGEIVSFIAQELFGINVSAESVSSGLNEVFSGMFSALATIWETVGKPIWDAISKAINWVAENWSTISAGFSSAFQGLWDVCKTVWETIGQPIWDMVSFAVDSLVNMFKDNMPAIKGFFQDAIAGIKDTWDNHLKPVFEAIGAFLENTIKPIFEAVWQNFIAPLIETVFNLIGKLWTDTLKPVFDGICDFITGVFTGDWQKMGDGIMGIVTGLWDGIKNIFGAVTDFLGDTFGKVKDFAVEKWSEVSENTKKAWTNVKNIVGDKMSEAKEAVEKHGGGIKGFIGATGETIKNNWSNAFNKMNEATGGKLGNMVDTIKSKFSTAKENALGIFDKIKSGISDKLESAKNVVSNIIEKIKGFFKFEWSLPKLKMPHFSVEGEFSLNPISIPKFNIEWYKEGGIMTDPTAFGINPSTGSLMVGGEAGAEAIAPISTLQEYVEESVARQNGGLLDALQNIVDVLSDLRETLPEELAESVASLKFEINNREFARLVREV